MAPRGGHLELVSCGLVWGSIGVITKEIDVTSGTIVFFRLSLAALVALAWVALRRRTRSLRLARERGWVFALGAVLALHWLMMFEAFKRLDVATTILIVFLGPILVAAGAPLLLREPLERRTVVSLVASVGGIVLVAAPGAGSLDPLGVAAAGGSAVLFAALVLLGKRLTGVYDPPTLVVWQTGIAAVLVSPFLGTSSAGAIGRSLPPLLLLGIAYTGVLGIVYFHGLTKAKAQHAGILVYVEPASAILYDWAFRDVVPSTLTLAGGALIVAAGMNIVLGGRAPSVPEVPVQPMEA